MVTLKKPQITEKELVLGDYVSIHSSGPKRGDVQNVDPCAVVVSREEYFQRIQKQRDALLPPIQKPKGDLIDVRFRVTAAEKKARQHFSEIPMPEDNVVA